MKSAVIGFFMLVLLIFSAAAVQASENKTFRKNELNKSLGEAMEQSMKILTVNPLYHIERKSGSAEFTADFIQAFLAKITSNSDFTVEIFNVDVEKGLLDVRVTESFKQIIGYGEVSCRKSVVLDDVEIEQDTYFLITFLKEHSGQEVKPENLSVRKQVSVQSGNKLSPDILPEGVTEKEGYKFVGWKMTKPVNGTGPLYDKQNIAALTAWDNMEFVPVYQKMQVPGGQDKQPEL